MSFDTTSSPLLEALEEHLVAQLLSPTAQLQYSSGNVGHAELKPYVEEIRRISDRYTTHSVGSALPAPIDTRRAADAYALYYTPLNAAKLIFLTQHLVCNAPHLRILDFGSGPGTAVLALLSALKATFDVWCVETSPSMRATAQKLLSSWQGPSTVTKLALSATLPPESEGSFDLVIAANSVAELEEAHALSLVQELSQRVAPKGFLLLLEPGQLAHTRRLMSLRDRLVSQMTPIFPCTRRDPCPMLRASESDWCHGTLTWAQPKLSRQMDSLLGFNKHRIKFSAFIFQRDGLLRDGIRVISPPEKTPRGIEVTVCGRERYGVVRIKKGERTAGTRALERADVFDRLTCVELQGDAVYSLCEP